jgi:hypothetical protein
MRTRKRAGTLLLALLVAACGGEGTGPGDGGNGNGNGNGNEPEPEVEYFSTVLTRDNVVRANPPVSDASGVATLEWDSAVDRLRYRIVVDQMDSITAAHIHGPASTEINASIRLFLFSAPGGATGADITGELVTGAIEPGSSQFRLGATMEDVLRWMRNDSAHVMVHSIRYPGGEIRGQVALDSIS